MHAAIPTRWVKKVRGLAPIGDLIPAQTRLWSKYPVFGNIVCQGREKGKMLTCAAEKIAE